jgi:hypothetical protein
METDKPAVYEFRIKALLTAERAAWFEGLSVTAAEGGETLLRGVIQDQAALHGVLAKIRDLGLPLLKVERLSDW